jgi:hypothetical protein
MIREWGKATIFRSAWVGGLYVAAVFGQCIRVTGADLVYSGGVAHRGGRHYQHVRIECSVMGQAMKVRDSPIIIRF